jgi:hypothetical protein
VNLEEGGGGVAPRHSFLLPLPQPRRKDDCVERSYEPQDPRYVLRRLSSPVLFVVAPATYVPV